MGEPPRAAMTSRFPLGLVMGAAEVVETEDVAVSIMVEVAVMVLSVVEYEPEPEPSSYSVQEEVASSCGRGEAHTAATKREMPTRRWKNMATW